MYLKRQGNKYLKRQGNTYLVIISGRKNRTFMVTWILKVALDSHR